MSEFRNHAADIMANRQSRQSRARLCRTIVCVGRAPGPARPYSSADAPPRAIGTGMPVLPPDQTGLAAGCGIDISCAEAFPEPEVAEVAMTVSQTDPMPTREPNSTRGGATRWRLAALVLACVALPAAGDTSAATGGACWVPGTTPGLFDWTATPGIACRNGSGLAGTAVAAPTATAGHADRRTPQNPDTPTQFTFSGSAYMGIAVAF